MKKMLPYFDQELDALRLPKPNFTDDIDVVLRLMLAGLTDKETALELGKPERYVSWRIQRAVRLADTANRVTLAHAIGENKWF